MNLNKISRKLSLVLRHQPESIGLTLDEHGWVDVDGLLQCLSNGGMSVTKPTLQEVVESNDKQRFRFSDDGSRIRANQGHSLSVDLEMKEQTPPDILFHGPASRFLESITEEGLQTRNRQHVHLSLDRETATKVGSRHGRPVILEVDARKMHQDGYLFYQSDNGVWLTDSVSRVYLNNLKNK